MIYISKRTRQVVDSNRRADAGRVLNERRWIFDSARWKNKKRKQVSDREREREREGERKVSQASHTCAKVREFAVDVGVVWHREHELKHKSQNSTINSQQLFGIFQANNNKRRRRGRPSCLASSRDTWRRSGAGTRQHTPCRASTWSWARARSSICFFLKKIIIDEITKVNKNFLIM